MFIKIKDKKGFTLVEAVVSISIVVLIMSTIFANYGTFNDNLTLTSAAQELAVTVRQAQTYGLSVKEISLGGGSFDKAYGMFFDKSDSSSYYLFAESMAVDNKYSVGTGCGTGSANTECVQKFTLRNGVTITNICNESSCPPGGSVRMHVTFLRPNPDARIYFSGGGADVGPSLTGKVVMTSARGKTITLTIESTGQVLVGPII